MNVPDGPLDIEKLEETFMGNVDIIKQILSSFKESFIHFQEEFEAACNQEDSEAMSRLAHGLKGSSGNIRAEALSHQAAALQHSVDDRGDFQPLAEQVFISHKLLMAQIDSIISQ